MGGAADFAGAHWVAAGRGGMGRMPFALWVICCSDLSLCCAQHDDCAPARLAGVAPVARVDGGPCFSHLLQRRRPTGPWLGWLDTGDDRFSPRSPLLFVRRRGSTPRHPPLLDWRVGLLGPLSHGPVGGGCHHSRPAVGGGRPLLGLARHGLACGRTRGRRNQCHWCGSPVMAPA